MIFISKRLWSQAANLATYKNQVVERRVSMGDKTLDRQIDILSGQAEKRLQGEKFQIIRDRARQKEADLARRTALASMERPTDGLLPTVAALTGHERRNYSL